MGTGYTRNDTSNNIADGNVINASDLDGEFDAIQSAFDASSGHSHDGTTGEGPQIAAAGIANNAVALGTKTTGNYVATGAVSGVGLSGSASAEGATFTVTSNATNANTANTIVSRDASGNFSAGTITAALTGDVTGNVSGTSGSTTGNAATATALATGRTIGMTGDVVWTSASFDGSGNVTGTATIQANSVALGTDTTGNYVGTVTGGTGIDSTGATSGEGIAHTLSLDLNELTTSTSDGDGDFFAVVDSVGNQKKLTKGNINLSGFNNDSGFITSASSGISNVVEDTSPQLGGDLQSNGNDIDFADNDKAVFGNGSDLQIHWDGTDGHVAVTGTLNIDGSGETLAKFIDDGAVELYHNNAKKIETTATGITVTGTVAATAVTGDGSGLTNLPSGGDAGTLDGLDSSQFLRSDTTDTKTSGNLSFSDNIKARFGNGADLQIYHDGSDSYIKDGGTGQLRILATDLRINNAANDKSYITGTDGAEITLYHNGSGKLATTSTGVTVTGTLAATAVTGDGSGLTGIAAGATGGGSDQIFYENGQSVTTNYTISNGKNAMSAGPITINNGVTVTVGTGETWTVV